VTETPAGTPAPEGGDAAEKPTTAESAVDDRNEGTEVQEKTVAVPEREFAAWKTKQERYNELEEENRRLKEASSPTPAANGAQDSDLDPAEEERIRRFAADGDPIAKRELRRIEKEREEAANHRRWGAQLKAIPNEARRLEVYNEFMKGGYEDVNAARVALVERENAELRKQPREPKTTPGVPTGAREGPSPPATKVQQIPRSEWEVQMDTLSDEERRALQRRVINGEVKIT